MGKSKTNEERSSSSSSGEETLPLKLGEAFDLKVRCEGYLYSLEAIIPVLYDESKENKALKDKKEIKGALKGIKECLSILSEAYLKVAAGQGAVRKFVRCLQTEMSALKASRSDQMEQLQKDLSQSVKDCIESEVKVAIGRHLKLGNFTDDAAQSATYAAAIKKPLEQCDVVKLSDGINVQPNNRIEFSIVPKPDAAAKFKSSEDVAKTVYRCVDPAKYGLKASRTIKSRITAVRVSAEAVDIDKLRTSKDLSEAGLEIKTSEKWSPRLKIIGVPHYISKEDLPSKLIETNNLCGDPSQIKVIHSFEKRGNENASVVIIEVPADLRRQLITLGKLFLGWSVCKVEDHVSIRQCFKCLQLGHLSRECPHKEERCSKCMGSHDSRNCEVRAENFKCFNCMEMKSADMNHCATDMRSCHFLINRCKRKILNTAY